MKSNSSLLDSSLDSSFDSSLDSSFDSSLDSFLNSSFDSSLGFSFDSSSDFSLDSSSDFLFSTSNLFDSSHLLFLNHSFQFQNIINLQSLDAMKFLQTQLLTQQNLTAILSSQNSNDFCDTVVTELPIDQPKIVRKNFVASDLLSDGGGYLFSHQSEVFFKQSLSEHIELKDSNLKEDKSE